MLVVSSYATLGSFSWDQDNDKIKIYISTEDADQEKVDAVFKPVSVDLKLYDINGKNYQFSIPKLNKEISPDQCELVVKPTKVIATLVKASKGNWLDLHFKEDKGCKKVNLWPWRAFTVCSFSQILTKTKIRWLELWI
ncbi:calcyclin-binding protein-like [Zingiber officinale]|uniref:calcyclin-binding protein-like n=1 Tax=Zingiber officinale TaxID=94328 RepID=UPI001C4C8791|nr:calcyclin-binding protein-like [Zingiber officinale]